MNIKINLEQASWLSDRQLSRYTIGSHMYGTNKEGSDKDILVFYKGFGMDIDACLAVRHQFQYDDKKNNVQWIYTTIAQWWRNLLSGESTINADMVMFSDVLVSMGYQDSDLLNVLRTYNTIKAYLGFAKRDIKDLKQGKGKNKQFHAQRGILCADYLMRGQIPTKEDIQAIVPGAFDLEEIQFTEAMYRAKCNNLYDSGELTLFPKEKLLGLEKTDVIENELLSLYYNSMNIKEFRYE